MKTRTWATIRLSMLAALAGVAFVYAAKPTAKAIPAPGDQIVAAELVLLVDTSGSIDESEYALQRAGYVDAFKDSEVIAAVAELRGLAVTYVEWSGADHQMTRVPWTLLESGSDCFAFANQIAALERTHEGSTTVAPALQFAVDSLATNGYIGIKRVIDVSGDGRCKNYDYYLDGTQPFSTEFGTPWNDTLPNVQAAVTQVNGICITTDQTVVDFYTDILPQGPNAFSMQVDTFSEFGDAIIEKILREVLSLPGMFD